MVQAAAKERISLTDESFNFTNTCKDIRSRGFYPQRPLTKSEADFPLAFASIVYMDYIQIEMMFRVIYAPQNSYCYVLDSKASPIFKKRMRNLADCFSNVVVPKEEFSVESNGKNTSNAHLACMKALQKLKWKYVMLFQNHDVPLRTNAELVEIFKIFNGSNDVSTFTPSGGTLNNNANRTFAALHLYRNESINQIREDGKLLELVPTKSLIGVALSYAMVDFLLNELNVTGFAQQLEQGVNYGMDENFLSTLNSNDVLGAPGGFTRACLERGFSVGAISRFVVWSWESGCSSRHYRHNVCIFGVEDLLMLTKQKMLFANKMMLSFDFGAITCWLEHIYNRTYSGHMHPSTLDTNFYKQLPVVRYGQLKARLNAGERVNFYTFNCSQSFKNS
uniref:Uncharacterized protein n=1 Tax=Ditylenchus dipsaci TaxID=166011 RepID=A0A915ECL4_9BILA